MIFRRIPIERVNWTTSIFLIGTFVLTLTAVPLYLWKFGIDWFQIALFVFMAFATGMSITLGYHRLFSHITFQAAWPVRLFTLLFGAAAFENSALMWCSEHRHHHKHVDHDELDPYAISKGFFWAHIGWLLFKLDSDEPYDNVGDLEKDRLVVWQDKYVQWIAVVVSFVFPAIARFSLERLERCAGRLPHRWCRPRGDRAALHLFHQLGLPHFGNRPYSVKLQRA